MSSNELINIMKEFGVEVRMLGTDEEPSPNGVAMADMLTEIHRLRNVTAQDEHYPTREEVAEWDAVYRGDPAPDVAATRTRVAQWLIDQFDGDRHVSPSGHTIAVRNHPDRDMWFKAADDLLRLIAAPADRAVYDQDGYDNEPLASQVDRLARILIDEFGGPTQSEGAIDMAIRLLRKYEAERAEMLATIDGLATDALRAAPAGEGDQG